MYGVPSDLNLSTFIGVKLQQVCASEYQVQFRFEADRWIGVEGKCQILDQAGRSVAEVARDSTSNDKQFEMLLGQKVVGSSVNAPDWFDLRFEGGLVLRVFDDSQQFESFSIQPGNIFV